MANSEAIPNVNLLLQLLTNPTALQQAIMTITQNQQISSAPAISTPSNALIGVINTSFPSGSIQNPITKEEWNQWKKKKQPKRTGKIFFNYHMIHIGLIGQRNLRDRLNATCEKGKYASEQTPGKIRSVITSVSSFKSDFPTFPVSVGDFVLQKITEDIVGNWEKIKEAQIQGIEPPPKCKNITPPNPKLKKMKSIPPAPISNAALTEIEINDSDIQNVQINDTHIQFNNVDVQFNDTDVQSNDTDVQSNDVDVQFNDTNVQLSSQIQKDVRKSGNQEKQTRKTRANQKKVTKTTGDQITTRNTCNTRKKVKK
ncbi:unnamed protein product [Rhizophagus irregularis]|nr:unnamed protein product [Rhizophagus irregularis]